jgi:hypothetical protein
MRAREKERKIERKGRGSLRVSPQIDRQTRHGEI